MLFFFKKKIKTTDSTPQTTDSKTKNKTKNTENWSNKKALRAEFKTNYWLLKVKLKTYWQYWGI